MAIQVPSEITIGENIPVTILNSSHAGSTVYVSITNDEGGSEQLPIHLDAAGNGTAQWFVESWSVVYFNYGTCEQATRHPQTVLA